MERETLYINLIGGPNAGKSTQAALVFGLLKLSGVNVELVTEYAKQCTWLENFKTLSNQFYVTAKQFHRQEMLDGLVDVVVTDSPIMVGIIYGGKKCPDSFNQCVLDIFRLQNNYNILLERGNYEYNPIGRNQDEEESQLIGKKMKEFLEKESIQYDLMIPDGIETSQEIVRRVMKKLYLTG